jgi:carboxypeptidase Taq
MDDHALISEAQKDILSLRGISALLDWDEKTYMPEKGIEERAHQLALIEGYTHDKMVSEELFSAVKRLKKENLAEKDSIIVRELFKDLEKMRKIPKELAESLVKETTLASGVWQLARKKDDFNHFVPSLERVIKLKQKEAHHLNPMVSCYDALLEEFEEGMTSEKLENVFVPLKEDLVSLLHDITQSHVYGDYTKTDIQISRADQETIVKDIIKKMGIVDETVSLDVSEHPFTTRIGEFDVRITTRYRSQMDCFFSGVHEAGHALYELGYPKEYSNTVVYDAPSLGIHESQSRFWENLVCRSNDFWEGYFPYFKRFLKNPLSLEEFFAEINHVTPSFIRTDADEVTYCLHVILRFEIERDLMNGKLSIKDTPRAWNDKMKEFLGITPPSDNKGVLQDVHWSFGGMGYFPTYAIGSIYSAQLFNAFSEENSNTQKLIKTQEFSPILEWLGKHVHEKGRTMLADDIIKKACGRGLHPKAYVDYVKGKYGKLYDL